MYVYTANTAAVGNFTGSATGELAGVLCLLDAIKVAIRDGTITQQDYVLMNTDSEAVYRYIAMRRRPGVAYLRPMVELVHRRMREMFAEGPGWGMVKIDRRDNSDADRLAWDALRLARQSAYWLGSTDANGIFLVDQCIGGEERDALYCATLGNSVI